MVLDVERKACTLMSTSTSMSMSMSMLMSMSMSMLMSMMSILMLMSMYGDAPPIRLRQVKQNNKQRSRIGT